MPICKRLYQIFLCFTVILAIVGGILCFQIVDIVFILATECSKSGLIVASLRIELCNFTAERRTKVSKITWQVQLGLGRRALFRHRSLPTMAKQFGSHHKLKSSAFAYQQPISDLIAYGF